MKLVLIIIGNKHFMSGSYYKDAFIYFWSGTGNSYRTAVRMGKAAEENGLTTRVLSIDNCNPVEELKTGRGSLMGIVFPTHGFTAPWHVIKFASKLPNGNSTPAFCAATRAGLKFGRLLIPGISGSATFIIALILMLKGYRVRGLMSVDMPSNWYSLHPIQGKENHLSIINSAVIKTDFFMQKLISGGKVLLTINNLIAAIWGILLSLISFGYLMIGRFFLAKLFFANDNCDGCGICEKYCPVGAIRMRGKENPKPFWKYNCESCMRCSGFCTRNAIEAGQSWGVILYFIAAVPFSAYLFSWLSRSISGIENLTETWIGDVVDYIYYYPAIFISYMVFNTLLRIPAVNWIFTHTTMTHFSFWGRYREPNTQLKNLEGRKRIKERLNV